MRLDPHTLVYGVEPTILVECARQLREYDSFTFEDFCMALGAPAPESRPVLEHMVADGYIRHGTEPDRPLRQTRKLGQLALARVTKGLTRREADELLDAVLAKATEINTDTAAYDRCSVACLAVFGSYLGTAPILGDLDIAVEVETPPGLQHEIGDIVRMLRGRKSLPEQMVLTALRLNKPKKISIHLMSEVLNLGTPYRIVFGSILPNELGRQADRARSQPLDQ